jgi:hypothetical protein
MWRAEGGCPRLLTTGLVQCPGPTSSTREAQASAWASRVSRQVLRMTTRRRVRSGEPSSTHGPYRHRDSCGHRRRLGRPETRDLNGPTLAALGLRSTSQPRCGPPQDTPNPGSVLIRFRRFPKCGRGYRSAHERRSPRRNDVAIFPDPAPARQKAAAKTSAARQRARKKATGREKTAESKPAPKQGDSRSADGPGGLSERGRR